MNQNNQSITMSKKELNRVEIMSQLVKKQITDSVAAKIMEITIRQVYRLKKRFDESGAIGLIHCLRGKKSNRGISEETIKIALDLIKEKYHDFGPTFAQEKLLENHQLKISVEKLRQLMIGDEIWKSKPRKSNGEYRSWRPRKECFGEMLQFDGSYHHWFEERGEEACLLATIDDATGKILKGKFANNEGVASVFDFWWNYVENNGKPMSIYLDKFSTYKINHKSAEDNKEMMTQFQRAMGELDIRLISAHSPQAKGRIERLFETLQDRLVKELRLRNISDVVTANEFLEKEFIPKFNDKFAVVPVKSANAHRSLLDLEKERLASIFSVQADRSISNDFTIRFKNKWLQLAERQPLLVLRKNKVIVEERLDGSIFLRLRDKYLNFKILTERPIKIQDKIIALSSAKSSSRPPLDHPWRKWTTRKPQKVEIKTNQS